MQINLTKILIYGCLGRVLVEIKMKVALEREMVEESGGDGMKERMSR